jgi:hypothetical protein
MTYLLKKEEMKLELVKTYRQSHVAETISLSIAFSIDRPFIPYHISHLEKTPYK